MKMLYWIAARNLLLLSLFSSLLLNSGCKKDEKSLRAQLIGDWESKNFEINGQPNTNLRLEMEFDDDDEFKLNIIAPDNTSILFTGDWEVDEDREELEFVYNPRGDIYYGLAGLIEEFDIPIERYDIRFSEGDLFLEGTIASTRIEIVLEKN